MATHPLHLVSLTIGLVTATVVWWALAYWVARVYGASNPTEQS
ncbi:MAG: hypothetical protein AAGE59_11925 [Cyanobacteria bacterium P01_F01_bin.86]